MVNGFVSDVGLSLSLSLSQPIDTLKNLRLHISISQLFSTAAAADKINDFVFTSQLASLN